MLRGQRPSLVEGYLQGSRLHGFLVTSGSIVKHLSACHGMPSAHRDVCEVSAMYW